MRSARAIGAVAKTFEKVLLRRDVHHFRHPICLIGLGRVNPLVEIAPQHGDRYVYRDTFNDSSSGLNHRTRVDSCSTAPSIASDDFLAH
jgi:hypothetical protein